MKIRRLNDVKINKGRPVFSIFFLTLCLKLRKYEKVLIFKFLLDN